MCNNKLTKEQGNITPCTGQGGLVDGPRPCGGCGSAGRLPRPQEGEGRETGSPQGWGLLPAGTWQDWGDPPHPSSEKAVGEGPTWQWEVRGTPLRAPGEALGSARSWHRGSILPAPTLLHGCGGLTGNLNVG